MMMHRLAGFVAGLAFAGGVIADEAPIVDPSGTQQKTMTGMSVLGNNEAPKSLVLVPWKSSEIGDGMDVARSLENRPMPVDREVFSRQLRYYELRTAVSDGVSTPKSHHVVRR